MAYGYLGNLLPFFAAPNFLQCHWCQRHLVFQFTPTPLAEYLPNDHSRQMNEELLNPSEVAQRRRQEAIERINKDLQAVPDMPSVAGEQSSRTDGVSKSESTGGCLGYIAADGTYVPNRIALKTRITNCLLSLGIVAYGYWGLRRDDLTVPISKRTASHFHNFSAWVMYAAMLCASVHLTAIVVDHYDRRNNEHLYQRVGNLSKKLGWGLFGIAFIVGFTHHQIDFR